MTWNLLLYGCFTSRGRGYEFDVLAPHDMVAGRKIRSASLASPSYFAGRFDDRAFFGTRDLVGKFLGWTHPAARDRARNLEFFLAYMGPGNATLPAWSEVCELRQKMGEDLRVAAELAMGSSKPVSRTVAADVPQFSGPPSSGAQYSWDPLVAQLTNGKNGLVHTIGDTVDLLVWEAIGRTVGHGHSDDRSTDQDESDGRGCMVRSVGLGLLATLLGVAAVTGLSSNSRANGDDKPSSGDP